MRRANATEVGTQVVPVLVKGIMIDASACIDVSITRFNIEVSARDSANVTATDENFMAGLKRNRAVGSLERSAAVGPGPGLIRRSAIQVNAANPIPNSVLCRGKIHPGGEAEGPARSAHDAGVVPENDVAPSLQG